MTHSRNRLRSRPNRVSSVRAAPRKCPYARMAGARRASFGSTGPPSPRRAAAEKSSPAGLTTDLGPRRLTCTMDSASASTGDRSPHRSRLAPCSARSKMSSCAVLSMRLQTSNRWFRSHVECSRRAVSSTPKRANPPEMRAPTKIPDMHGSLALVTPPLDGPTEPSTHITRYQGTHTEDRPDCGALCASDKRAPGHNSATRLVCTMPVGARQGTPGGRISTAASLSRYGSKLMIPVVADADGPPVQARNRYSNQDSNRSTRGGFLRLPVGIWPALRNGRGRPATVLALLWIRSLGVRVPPSALTSHRESPAQRAAPPSDMQSSGVGEGGGK
jgi:hypothetical protein